MGLGISVSKHALNSAAPLRSPQHFFLSCILHMHPHHTHARATASLLSHSSWFWMWSTFRCMKVQCVCVCGCGYIICEVLPWIGHACGCAGPATLHCLGWAPSEGGLSPAHKSCQQQIRRECLVMITTQTQTRFPFFIYFFFVLVWQEHWSNTAEEIQQTVCARLLPHTLPLPSWEG